MIKSEFKKTLTQKFQDITDVLLHSFEKGIFSNKNKIVFTEEEISGSIEFYTYCHTDEYDLPQFKTALDEKSKIATDQIFYAIEKGIEGNKIEIEVSKGNITCHITIKTATQQDNTLLFFGEERTNHEENDDAKHMTV